MEQSYIAGGYCRKLGRMMLTTLSVNMMVSFRLLL